MDDAEALSMQLVLASGAAADQLLLPSVGSCGKSKESAGPSAVADSSSTSRPNDSLHAKRSVNRLK